MIQDQIEALRSYKNIRSVMYDERKDLYTVETEDLYLDGVNIGRFLILVSFYLEIQLHENNLRVSLFDNDFETHCHPHITILDDEIEPCFGGYASPIVNAIGAKRVEEVVNLVLDFLTSYQKNTSYFYDKAFNRLKEKREEQDGQQTSHL